MTYDPTACNEAAAAITRSNREIDAEVYQIDHGKPTETLPGILVARSNLAIAAAILALADAVNRPADDVPFRLRPDQDHPAQDL